MKQISKSYIHETNIKVSHETNIEMSHKMNIEIHLLKKTNIELLHETNRNIKYLSQSACSTASSFLFISIRLSAVFLSFGW